MKRYLFLDIDGVMIPFGDKEIAPGCAENLRRIMSAVPGLGIVIASAWHMPPVERLLRIWRKAGLPEAWIVGFTPDLSCVPGSVPEKLRGMEIRHWLDGHAHETACYAILDDQTDEIESCFPSAPIFTTAPDIGLDRDTAHAIVRRLQLT